MSVDREAIVRLVELCPLCGVKALENPSTAAEAITGMREHIRLNHHRLNVLQFDLAVARRAAQQGRRP